MSNPSILVLYNEPLLPRDHPDAEQEYAVLAVADFVATTLTAAGFRARLLGLGTDPTLLWTELQSRPVDAVFNLFEGHLDNPETESYVAALLEWAGVPFTGSPFPALALARAKHKTKYLFRGAGMPTADFQVVHALPVPTCTVPFPVIVKPATQDASIGIDHGSVCVSQLEVETRVSRLLAAYGGPVLVEEYLPGREFNVSVLELPELQTLTPMEIVLPAEANGRWSILTYAGKWQTGSAEYTATPSRFAKDLAPETLAELSRLALRAFHLLGCRHYARVDFRVKPDGSAYVLELNPNPDISPEADLTACLGSAGLSHAQFLVKLVQHALSRRTTKG